MFFSFSVPVMVNKVVGLYLVKLGSGI